MLESFSLRGMAAAARGALRRRRSPAPRCIASAAAPALAAGAAALHRPAGRGEPLVSIVTPCFNHGRYLPELIDGDCRPGLSGDRADHRRRRLDGPARRSRRLAGSSSRGGAPVIRQNDNRGPSVGTQPRHRGGERAATSFRSTPTTCCCQARFAAWWRNCRPPASGSASSIPGFQYFGNRDYSLRSARLQPVRAAGGQFRRHVLAARPGDLRRRLDLCRRHRARP